MKNSFNIGLLIGTIVHILINIFLIYPNIESEGYKKGFIKGSMDYHQRCLETSGIMVDEQTLNSVHCKGLGKINPQEITHVIRNN